MLSNMAVQKTAWAPNTILKPHCGHQSNDCFCGLENIQAAMSCSGILGGGIHGAIYGRGDNCFGGPNGRSENDGKRVSGVRGNIGGVASFDSRSAASNESFVRDGMQKFPSGHNSPYTLFSNLESRNPLLESMTVNPLQSSEISDGGQFSPGSGRNSGMRQNLDELVSKILDEDSSQSARQMDEAFGGIGLEEKRPSHGILSVTNSDFSENVRNIWSFDGKPPIVTQTQQHQQHIPSISSGQFKVPLDNQWQVVRLTAEKPTSQGVTTSGYHHQSVDSSVYSARKPAYGATGDNNNQFLQQIGRQKFEGGGATGYGSLAMKPSSVEMDLALRCLEKSGPLASPRGSVPSDVYSHYNAWSKMSNACSSQNLGGNPGLMVNCFPNGNPSSFAVVSMGPAATNCESRPEAKSGMELLMGSNVQQAGGAAKQYLSRCFSQLGGSEEMREGQLEAQQRQLIRSLQGSADIGQNLLIPASMKVCAERNQADQSILYGIGKAAAGSTVRNGHNVSMYPVGKYPLWSAAAMHSGMVPSSALLNALAGEKKDLDMNGVPYSSGNPMVDQNQQLGYGQPNGKKAGNYAPSPAFVQGVSAVPMQPPDLSQCPESVWCQLQDVPVFQAESLYPCQQPSNGGGGGFQFDLSGIPKAVPQQNQIPLRGIQSQWINPPLHAADGCECGTRCDVHNIGRATPVILRPGEIFYNNMPPQAVFGLSQYMPPDVKLKRCLTTSSSLLICLEDCFEQLRSLEKEGKEVENELMQHKIGKSLASVNPTSVPRLPNNPSRVNRLVVESLREHSKVIAILGKLKKIRLLHANIYSAMETWMEGIRKVQARRKEEIVSSANRSNSGGSRTQEEKDILALTAAVEELLSQTRRARTCLWCAVQISLYGSVLSSDKGAPAESCGSSVIYGLMGNEWCSADAGCFGGGQNSLKMEN